MTREFSLPGFDMNRGGPLRLIDQMALGLLITDLDDHILYANRSCCKMFGYAEHDLLGQDAKVLLFSEDEEVRRMQRHTKRHLAGLADSYVLRLVHRRGHTVWVRVFGTVLYDDEGEPIGTMGILQDITRQREIESTLQQRNQELSDLAAFHRDLGMQSTVDEVATTAVQGLLTIIPADLVILLQHQGSALVPLKVEAVRNDIPISAFGTVQIGECLCGLAAQQRRPLYSTDLYDDERCTRQDCTQVEISAMAAMPLLVGDELLGVIGIGSFSERDFQLQEDFLLAASGEIALALHRSEQLQTEQRLRRRAQVMQHVATIIGSSLELDAVLDNILTQLQIIIPYDSASISLYEGDYARMIACRGFTHPENIIGRTFYANTYFENTIRQTKQPLVVSDATADPRFQNWGSGYDIRGWLLTPLLVRGKVIGCLSIDSHVPDYFQPHHVEDATEFAVHAASAIENARLYERVHQYAAELEERVAQRTQQLQARVAMVEKLNQALLNVMADLKASRQQLSFYARNLEQANAELESFAYSVSHDLRAPLRHIAGFAQLLAMDYGDQLDETAHSYIQALQESTRTMDLLIQGLLSFSRLGRKAMHVKMVQPKEIVADVWQRLYEPSPDRTVELRLGELPPCQADPLLLQQVFSNLLSNALKYSSTRAHAIIEVGFKEDGEEGAYFVRDNGVGFDMKYVDKLFGIFQRLHTEEEFAGVGVGLAIVQRIINRHGGRVWAEAALDQGATFYFTLPQRIPMT